MRGKDSPSRSSPMDLSIFINDDGDDYVFERVFKKIRRPIASMSYSTKKGSLRSSVDKDDGVSSLNRDEDRSALLFFKDGGSGDFQQFGGSSRSGSTPPMSSFSALQPQKRKSNDLSSLTIDKLKFDSLGIHGRDPEIAALKSQCNSLLEATSERRLTLISGASGSGKSKLAETLRHRLVRHKGLHARGKFDLNMRNEPYSGIAGACAEICGSVLKLREEEPIKFQMLCKEIETALGSEASLLARVIPAIEELVETALTSGTSSPQSSPGDAKNRIQFAFLRFFRVVSKEFSPLLIVLDDLQWADSSSLDLLEVLMLDRKNPKFMVIGIYRSNEVDETHIFYKCLRELEQRSLDGDFILSRLEINDLDIEAVHGIIQDLLNCQGDSRTLVLAQICLYKTNGNPFYLLHYLAMLYNKKLLQFNFGTLSWTWNEEEIESSTQASDNVVDLLKRKMFCLPTNVLKLLKLASCLGSTFEVETLRLLWVKLDVDGSSIDDSLFSAGLTQLEEEGLFAKGSELPPRRRWSHDKIHEAAIELVPEDERGAWKQRTGEILVSELNEEKLDSAIFVVVNLLNEAPLETSNVESQLKLARLNLGASYKAIKVSAFESAAKYAGKGIELLPDNHWKEHYDLSLSLYSIGAKAEGFLGNVEMMECYCKAVLSQDDHPLVDKLDVYHTWIDSVLNRAKVQEATDLALEVLAKFKCRFPKNPVFVGLGVVSNIIGIKATMKSRQPAKRPRMTDKTRIELMKLLDKLATCFYMLKDDRLPLAVFRSLNWTMKYGVCDYSSAAFATTGMMLTGILDDIQGGAFYGQHALDLLRGSGSKLMASRVMFCVHSLLFAWTQPFRSQTKPLLQAYDMGLQTGDTESACYAIFNFIVLQFYSGVPLQMLETDLFLYSKQMKDLKREQAAKLADPVRQLFRNLMGLDNAEDPTKFTGQAITDEHLERSRGDDFWNAGVILCQGSLFTYFGQHTRQADFMIKFGHDYVAKSQVASPQIVFDTYQKGVSCFAAARTTGKKKYARLAQICRGKVRKWQEKGNPNVKHHESLLEAEFLAYKGRRYPAIKQYEVSILLAARGGYQHDAGLASERLAEFQIEVMKDLDEGKYRLREAMKYYSSWGANAKVEHLEKKYPELLTPQQPFEVVAVNPGGELDNRHLLVGHGGY